ncbi:MAG: Crp/Fnr family transcriptional regulator [Myxococcota bacterium]|nr:Crp/Fnr family transcriptional regulator [Myxococcota bacterium]
MISEPDRGYPGPLADEEGWVLVEVWHLHSVDWIRELADEDVEKLRAASAYRDYRAGETIFAPERDPHSVYLLERGLVRIYRLSSEGSETTFGYVAPGEVFGELAAFGDYPRESFAEAVRASRVWKIRATSFRQVMGARPEMAIEITRQVGARLKRIESRVENLVFRDVRSRLAHILLEVAADLSEKDGEALVLQVDFTQADLATLVGATRQTINACMRELEDEGVVGRQGRRLSLLRPERLRTLARDGESR